MGITNYTVQQLRTELLALQARYPDAVLQTWGIEVRDGSTRLWADFVPSDRSDLLQAYCLL